SCGAKNTPCCASNVCNTGASCCHGTCVDLQGDSKNCSTCDHDCLGGTCMGATCQPTTVASNQADIGNSRGLATDGPYVYWSGGGGGSGYIGGRRVDASDSTRSIASGQPSIVTFALSPTAIYWVSGGHVRVCDLPDCSLGPRDLISTVVSTPHSACEKSIL